MLARRLAALGEHYARQRLQRHCRRNLEDEGGWRQHHHHRIGRLLDQGFPRRAAYGAAKGGVIGLTKAVAADYVSQGIRCNSVCPGTVASPSLEERIGELGEKLGSRDEAYRSFISRQPAGRFGTVEEVAAICAFLASDEAAFITGQAINIDGGITI